MDSMPIEDLQASPRKPLYTSTPFDDDVKDIGSLNVSPWRPGHMLPMMPLEDVIEEDEENCTMDESLTEPQKLEPIAEESLSDVKMHDYGWLDLGGQLEQPKPRGSGLTVSTNTHTSSTLPRGFKLKRSVIRGLISKTDKREPLSEHQKENVISHRENHGAVSHGHKEMHGPVVHRHREKRNMFLHTETRGMYAHGHNGNHGVFPHGYSETALDCGVFSQKETGLSTRQNQFGHQDKYAAMQQGFANYDMHYDIGNNAGSSHLASTLPRQKRVSFKDFS